jgi:hypothetical protein
VVLVVVLVLWLPVKAAYELALMPRRLHGRDLHASAACLADAVPPGTTLAFDRLKDDGLLFYADRSARRRSAEACLSSSSELVYALWTQDEWAARQAHPRCREMARLRDQQGHPLVLVRIDPAPEARTP